MEFEGIYRGQGDIIGQESLSQLSRTFSCKLSAVRVLVPDGEKDIDRQFV